MTLGEAIMSGLRIEPLHAMFRALAPAMALPPTDRARAIQTCDFARTAHARGAPLSRREIGELVHFFHPDGKGLWEDVGALEHNLRALAGWAEVYYGGT